MRNRVARRGLARSDQARMHLLHIQHGFQRALAEPSFRMLRLLLGALDRGEILHRPLRRRRRSVTETLRLEGFAGLLGAVELARAVDRDAAPLRLDLLRLDLWRK